MSTTVKLEQNLDLQATGRLVEAVSKARAAVALDGSAVVHVGGLAAQLILALHRAGGPKGKGLTLTNPSADCTAGFLRLGIDPAKFA